MSTARSWGHHGKTPEEVKKYHDTVIREQGPTVEPPALESDSTDVPQHAPSVPYKLKSTKEPPWLLNLIKTEWDKFAMGGVLVAALAWGGSTLYSLNREVGVLAGQITSVRDNIDLLRESRREDYERLTEDLDRLETNFQRLEDRLRN